MRLVTSALSAVALVIAGCSPKAEAPAAPAPAPAVEPAAAAPAEPKPTSNPGKFGGSWKVAKSEVAPWWDGKGEKPKAEPGLDTQPIVLGDPASTGPGIFHCEKSLYTIRTTEPAGLFEGNLPEPDKQAAALGFKPGPITTMNQGCESSTGDLELDFPMVDDDTILLGLNNMIYTLKRQK
jgi:hypothetical protein